MTRLLAEEDGQVLALTALMLTVLIGVATLVLDVGTWFREDRQLQAAVDAAAAAGAQALPEDPGRAVQLALEYAGKNGGGVAAEGVSLGTGTGFDSITVRGSRDAPGFFSRVFGVLSVEVGARATARSSALARARYAAPIAVHETHPFLQCEPDPCFDLETQLPLGKLKDSGNGAGAFGLVDYTSGNGSASAGQIADWILHGYDGLLSPGLYGSAPGAKFNSSQVRDAFAERTGDDVLLPVYRSITGNGANAQYDVVGWVGFTISGFSGGGDSGTITGRFRRLTWEGEEGPADSAAPDLGARVVALVE